jgi:hypothetical protein
MDRLKAPKGAGYMLITQTPDPLVERARVTSLVVPPAMLQGGTPGGAQKVMAQAGGKPHTIRTVAQMDRPDWAYTQVRESFKC